MKDKIIIANASGFWGDEAAAVKRQVEGGPIDYLTMDYLAEITMIILGRQKAKSEDLGYAADFVSHVGSVLDTIVERDIRVIANAGGMNPGACARALSHLMEERGVSLPVAVVDGDDLMPRLNDLVEAGQTFPHLETGEPAGERLQSVNTANAYVGARPIVGALEQGARIVITGRTYDAASIVAPFVYEFGWQWDDWNKLASALLAGHLAECGAQATGGNFSLWKEVSSFENFGYPLIEAEPDGSFVLTKHPGTGGRVDRRTATEQILYEIGDPRRYRSPDVDADFTSFTLADEGKDRVRVKGTRGRAPGSKLKVSMTYESGFKATAGLIVSGPDVIAKAEKFAEIFWSRVGTEFDDYRTDFVGYNGCWGDAVRSGGEPPEIWVRFAARSSDQKRLARFARELAGVALAGPPGVCGAGGRPHISPAFGFWPTLIGREHVTARMAIEGGGADFPADLGEVDDMDVAASDEVVSAPASGATETVPLSTIAFARSGDKGDAANIGVAAKHPKFFPVILREVTSERVQKYFHSTIKGPVSRYELANLDALNFFCRNALGGGGTISLLVDAQGKTLSQGLLCMPIDVETDLLAELNS